MYDDKSVSAEVIKKNINYKFFNRNHFIIMINIKPIFFQEIQMYHFMNMLKIKNTQKNHLKKQWKR
mgnify:CR=1 FL=1